MKQILIAAGFWLSAATAVLAAPIAYALDAPNTIVSFEVPFNEGAPIKGRFPVASADISLDFKGRGSKVDVSLDARGATANNPFAQQALRGPKVLGVKAFPDIRFRAEGFPIGAQSAEIPGEVTLRGVTRPVTLTAQVFRQQGVEVGDRSRMSVHLSGRLSRSEFGATGWPELVGDVVTIDIIARLDQRTSP